MTSKLDNLINMLVVKFGSRPNLKGRIEVEMDFVKTFMLEGDPQLLPWFLLSHDETVSTVADQAYVELPSDFISEYEYGFLFDDQGYPINKGEDHKLKGRNRLDTGLQSQGRPTRYSILNGRLYLYPVPDAVYVLPIRYFQATAELANSADTNPWLLYGADWLMNATGVAIAEDLQYVDAQAAFVKSANRARARIEAKNAEEEVKNLEGTP